MCVYIHFIFIYIHRQIWSFFEMFVVVPCEFPSWFAYTSFIPSCRSAKGWMCVAEPFSTIIIPSCRLAKGLWWYQQAVIISLVAVRPKGVMQELAFNGHSLFVLFVVCNMSSAAQVSKHPRVVVFLKHLHANTYNRTLFARLVENEHVHFHSRAAQSTSLNSQGI
jgi:hypothetical protein